MRQIVNRLGTVARRIAKDRGPWLLFGLFSEGGSPETWNLVVSADWMSREKAKARKYVAERVQAALSKEELANIGGVFVVEPTNPMVEALRHIRVVGDDAELTDCYIGGLYVEKAYVIASDSQWAGTLAK